MCRGVKSPDTNAHGLAEVAHLALARDAPDRDEVAAGRQLPAVHSAIPANVVAAALLEAPERDASDEPQLRRPVTEHPRLAHDSLHDDSHAARGDQREGHQAAR